MLSPCPTPCFLLPQSPWLPSYILQSAMYFAVNWNLCSTFALYPSSMQRGILFRPRIQGSPLSSAIEWLTSMPSIWLVPQLPFLVVSPAGERSEQDSQQEWSQGWSSEGWCFLSLLTWPHSAWAQLRPPTWTCYDQQAHARFPSTVLIFCSIQHTFCEILKYVILSACPLLLYNQETRSFPTDFLCSFSLFSYPMWLLSEQRHQY